MPALPPVIAGFSYPPAKTSPVNLALMIYAAANRLLLVAPMGFPALPSGPRAGTVAMPVAAADPADQDAGRWLACSEDLVPGDGDALTISQHPAVTTSMEQAHRLKGR